MTGAKLLIVEDNTEVRENLAEILELYGYEVTEAADGLAGVKAALEAPPDMILCDVMMPELDGYGVLNLLSENERTAGIPFVFITARTEVEDVRRGMNLGADDYITKPFYKDELLTVIRTRLKKSRLRQQPEPAPARARLSDPEGGLNRLKQAFTEQGRQQTFDQGSYVLREDDYPHFVYRVVNGRVHLRRSHEYGRDYIVAELGASELFGLPAALERTPSPYAVKVAEQSTILQLLPVSVLFELINTDPRVTDALMRLMAGRVASYGDRLAHQAYDSVRRRTALILCDLHEKYDGAPIELSREELAQMVGTTKESATRALSDFRKDGLLTVKGKSVGIVDVKRLRELLV